MILNIYWRLDPAAEPQRSEPSMRHNARLIRDVRPVSLNRFDHYVQVARAAALASFDGLVVAYREEADDSQIIAAAVARSTPRLRLVPEFPASVGSAVYAAKQATSFQRSAQNRLGWAIVPDGDAASRARGADPIAAADLGARTEEFIHVARSVHDGRDVTIKGRFFEVQGGGFEAPLNRVPFPLVFLRGDDEEALERSARSADVHLFSIAPVEQLRDSIETLDRLALESDRGIAFGLIGTILARETDEEAHASGTADLVGSYETVADRLAELVSVGVTHIVLSAAPSLEEAYRIGQFVLPRVRARIPALRAAA